MSGVLEAWLSHVLLQMDLEMGPPLLGNIILYDEARSFGRNAHVPWEEEDTGLASQVSQINPSDQWGDRCHSQTAPTS